VRVVDGTIILMWPLVKMAEWMTRLMTRGRKKITIRRHEFEALAEIGVEEGEIHAEESRILSSLFRFSELRASDIMTPRTVLVAAKGSQTVGEVLDRQLRFSRIPVVGRDIDDVKGFVLRADLLEYALDGRRSAAVVDLVRPLIAVPDQMGLRDLFARLTEGSTHMALVVGEYGGTEGLVTMEDVIETLLGLEITDEVDTITDMQALARQQWERRARKMGLIEGA
jgi:CBS domain containing-hemolysin-like protein